MARSNSTSLSENMFVHVSFRVPRDSQEVEQKNIESLLDDLFKDSYELIYEDPQEIYERELVYKIQKPLMEDQDLLYDFFVRLKKVFVDKSRLLPAFTQGVE